MAAGLFPAGIYLFKVNNGNSRTLGKVTDKDNGTTF